MIEKLTSQTSRVLQPMGYEIVQINLIKGRRLTVQILIERSDWNPITLDDCGKVSQTLSPVLDAEIPSSYHLEVSSPGIERPLTRLKDFDRFKESRIYVEIEPAIADRSRYSGVLKGVNAESRIILETPQETFFLPFSSLRRAKLVV